MNEIGKQQVIEKLKSGWELRERGTGWWVSEPRRSYIRSQSDQVSGALVEQLEAEGVIVIELLTRTAVGRLKQ